MRVIAKQAVIYDGKQYAEGDVFDTDDNRRDAQVLEVLGKVSPYKGTLHARDLQAKETDDEQAAPKYSRRDLRARR